jgi:hypothetical protein
VQAGTLLSGQRGHVNGLLPLPFQGGEALLELGDLALAVGYQGSELDRGWGGRDGHGVGSF